MNKEIKIDCPEGYEIDKENSTFECIKFKPIKKELPKTWEEFCKNNNIKEGECFIGNFSNVHKVYLQNYTDRNDDSDRNVLPSKELAEAMLALCQLLQLRDCYNEGWQPDWTNKYEDKFTIRADANELVIGKNMNVSRSMVFKSKEIRDEFLKNFRDLLEIAKPLL